MATRIKARPGKLYDTDFVLWTREQAAALRAGRLDALDRDNLAEEVESLGRKDRRELESRLTVLVMHLLKWRHQPDQRGGSWDSTIRTQRREIEKLLNDSPSLRAAVAEALGKATTLLVATLRPRPASPSTSAAGLSFRASRRSWPRNGCPNPR